jgi:hypothetical protein
MFLILHLASRCPAWLAVPMRMVTCPKLGEKGFLDDSVPDK